MIESTSDPCDRYVYMLMREDGRTPFYIGKGRGRRINAHEKKWRQGFNKHKDAIIRGMQARGIPIPKMKVACGLSYLQANEVEKSLIEAYGRHPIGPLVNVFAGGDGGLDPTPELRAHFSTIRKGRTLSAEHKRKVGEAGKGRKATEQARANMRQAQKGSPGPSRDALAKAIAMRRPHSDERRARMAEWRRNRWWSSLKSVGLFWIAAHE